MISKSIISVAVIAALVSAPAVAQQIIYPAKGQSAQQQQKDEAECYTWAKGQTGYDPAASQAVAPPQQQPVGGERMRGAARGAVGGAVIGGIAGDTGKGAAIGATVGVMAGGARQRQKQAANQQAAAQQQQATAQQQQNFQRAYGACFEGRGYTVK
ncbi:MAG: glycine zipper family protein [Sulfurimicrobium sp.]|nr:glycine zipper family protein [Sulfurimicrobium sp.]